MYKIVMELIYYIKSITYRWNFFIDIESGQ